MTLRRSAVLGAVTAAMAASLALGGCSTDGATGAGTPEPQPALTAHLVGSCSDNGGYRLDGNNFTPNGQYQTVASYPDGEPYTYLANGGVGVADANGKTPQWSWDCRRGPNGNDTPGVYKITLIDITPEAPGNGRRVQFDLTIPENF